MRSTFPLSISRQQTPQSLRVGSQNDIEKQIQGVQIKYASKYGLDINDAFIGSVGLGDNELEDFLRKNFPEVLKKHLVSMRNEIKTLLRQ